MLATFLSVFSWKYEWMININFLTMTSFVTLFFIIEIINLYWVKICDFTWIVGKCKIIKGLYLYRWLLSSKWDREQLNREHPFIAYISPISWSSYIQCNYAIFMFKTTRDGRDSSRTILQMGQIFPYMTLISRYSYSTYHFQH